MKSKKQEEKARAKQEAPVAKPAVKKEKKVVKAPTVSKKAEEEQMLARAEE